MHKNRTQGCSSVSHHAGVRQAAHPCRPFCAEVSPLLGFQKVIQGSAEQTWEEMGRDRKKCHERFPKVRPAELLTTGRNFLLQSYDLGQERCWTQYLSQLSHQDAAQALGHYECHQAIIFHLNHTSGGKSRGNRVSALMVLWYILVQVGFSLPPQPWSGGMLKTGASWNQRCTLTKLCPNHWPGLSSSPRCSAESPPLLRLRAIVSSIWM